MRKTDIQIGAEYEIKIPHGPRGGKIAERARVIRLVQLPGVDAGWEVETLSATGILGPVHVVPSRSVVRPWAEVEHEQALRMDERRTADLEWAAARAAHRRKIGLIAAEFSGLNVPALHSQWESSPLEDAGEQILKAMGVNGSVTLTVRAGFLEAVANELRTLRRQVVQSGAAWATPDLPPDEPRDLRVRHEV